MWIKEPTYPLGNSLDKKLNFLYQSDKFFIMDNHLAAAWCWLQRINTINSYNLYHIDKHYDLLDNPSDIRSKVIDTEFNLSTCSFDDYLGLRQTLGNGDNIPLFRYDNYLVNLQCVYNSIYNKKYFATHKDDTERVGFIDSDNGDFEKEDYEIVKDLSEDIESHNENSWIVNLDVDYFFIDNGTYFQHLSDKYIQEICKKIKDSLDNISVVTIALSPECCGGWDKSYRITRMMAKCFDLDFTLNL